ncbi:cupin domain-containing carboxymuconolactone decarboxylase family protein [Aquirhabdus sp.]|uniref:(R)-mandelonitrile lyase n=1 Tax=Aquirhabdus sp. TaxID=2824160 RepID=UPI00396C550B
MTLTTTVYAQANEANAASSSSKHPIAVILHQADRESFAGAPEHFTGKVHVDMLFSPTSPARASAAYVTFEPGARTDWHVHPIGQTLVVTAGAGLIQFWGGPVQRIVAGDVVWIPAGQKHWHGASSDSAMTHLAIQEQLDGKSVDWLEKVSDAQYSGKEEESLPIADQTDNASTPTRAQQLMGSVAPKLAELTDKVLFGDVWQRPGLSKRDRSLVTVSALIAMNRPDQLRSHLILARQNGLTETEIVEAITQLAFYAGWPSAVTAVSVAKDVFEKDPH